MDDELWALEEFGAADLGDARRNARLLDLASTLARRPAAALPQACNDEAQLDAAYRFFDNKHLSHAAILHSHICATIERCAQQPRILAVQDTTLLDYSHHPATIGLGPLATPKQHGLFVHSTVAFVPEGLPLGLLAQQEWVRDPASVGKREQRRELPIEDKESNKWLTSLKAVNEAAKLCPESHFVSTGDREADVYDLFLLEREANVDLLVRASWDRRTSGEEHRLWACMHAANEQTWARVQLPKRGEHPARSVLLAVRWRKITLRAPEHRSKEKLADVELWAIWAIEEAPPAGEKALEWLLLSSCTVSDADGALEKLEWYACRWGIEVLHKVLKSGCKIEARQLGTAERLARALALYSVIAWRIMYGTLLGRLVPDAPCTALLEQEEWEALYCTIHKVAMPCREVPSLRQAVRWIGQLGGFLGRKSDGEPGVTVMWRGFQRLVDLTTMYRIMRPSALPRDVRKD